MNISLRALEPSDLDSLYEIENVQQYWLTGSTTVPYSRVVLADYIANQKADIYLDGQVRLAIVDSENVLGIVDLFNFDARNLRAEVGIVVRENCQGRGVATDALRKLILYARDFLMLEQLVAVVPERNSSSIALFRKCGFLQSCVLREWLRTSTSRENALLFQLFLKKD